MKSIEALCGGQQYPRLRFGISDNYPKGRQADYVLAPFDKDEEPELPALIDRSVELIKSFVTVGPAKTMTAFNS
jgi:PTH1 family peptidyl-tRNA hydrolase